MFEPKSEVIVSKVRTLNTVDPQRTMDEINHLIERTSIMELAEILKSTY